MKPLQVTYLNNNPVLEWSPYPDSIKYGIYRGTNKESLSKIGESNLLYYQDTDIDKMTKLDKVRYFYQVSSIQTDKEEKFTEIEEMEYAISYPVQGVLNEFVRRGNIMLDLAGEYVDFYIRIASGEHCTECYDEIFKNTDSAKPLCPVCYNTGYIGGFVKINSLVKIRNNVDDVKWVEWGIRMESAKMGWLTNYPIVNDGDFLRTKYGEIYLIGNTKHKRTRGFLHHQNFTLNILETNHPFYSIE